MSAITTIATAPRGGRTAPSLLRKDDLRLPEVTAVPARYIIYALRERASGRHYVGLTARSLKLRVTAHLSQARRDTAVRKGGLMEAIRRTLASECAFEDVWDVRVVDRTDDVDQARALERRWIATLGAHQPLGFNSMPGGSSVGGPSNALPFSLDLPDGTVRRYASIHNAIADLNRQAKAEGRPVVLPSTIYFRLSQGWSAAEAFGHVPHEDGRGQRIRFAAAGASYTTLRQAAAHSGVAIATLRSRLHRLAQAKSGPGSRDIGTDRRSCRQEGKRLEIAWPPTGETLTAAVFADRAGIPKATVIHRLYQARRHMARNGCALSPVALHRWLTVRVDRRKVLSLTLPDGTVWTGGERELVRRVLGDPALEASRSERLSESGIRRRLRTARDRCNAATVAEAFGWTNSRRKEA